MYKYLKDNFRDYIFIILTATIFYGIIFSKSLANDVFVVDNVIVEGTIDLNFSREKYLNKAFHDSFEILMTKVLLSRDLKKVRNIKLDQIKKLMSGFQILEESYSNNEYKASVKIL